MDPWTTSSRPAVQRIVAGALAAVGCALAVGGHRTGGLTHPATMLGLILVVLGVWGLAVAGPQTVTVDPAAGTITIDDDGPLGRRTDRIRFAQVDDVRVAWMGSVANHIGWHYLAVRLRDGRRVALFAPGRFYRGAANRSEVTGWCERLRRAIADHSGTTPAA